jgi:hypothetical protein
VRVSVVIPALNEEESIGRVLADLPHERITEVLVVDNGSSDATADRAGAAGARVISEMRRGYGSACLAGIAAADRPDTFLFLDADYSDDPREAGLLLDRIEDGCDLVIGSRALGEREAGALLPQARFGNWLAVSLIRLRFGHRFTDLGPFRAIRAEALSRLRMADRDFGWTIEMQIKAVTEGLRIAEVPVGYRCRIGRSKISGTIGGSFRAGVKILYTFWRYALRR